jgi:hypothetical protein
MHPLYPAVRAAISCWFKVSKPFFVISIDVVNGEPCIYIRTGFSCWRWLSVIPVSGSGASLFSSRSTISFLSQSLIAAYWGTVMISFSNFSLESNFFFIFWKILFVKKTAVCAPADLCARITTDILFIFLYILQ